MKIRYAALAIAVSACGSGGTTQVGALSQRASAGISVGPNVQVSAARPEEGHYETHAAAHPTDPNKILATAIIYPKQGRRGTIVYASKDAGKTWSISFQGDELTNTGDPAVGYGPDGVGYFATLTSAGHPLEKKPEKPSHNHEGRKTLLYRLPSGASKWEGPAQFWFADREYIVVDDTKGKYHGRVYVSGDPRPGAGFVVFTSTDGGRTFPDGQGTRSDIQEGGSIGNVGVASDGTIIGVYAARGHALAVRSVDGGKSFEPSVQIDTFVRAGGRKDRNANNVNHFMAMTIDRSGGKFNDRVYATWPDRRTGQSKNYFSYSTDRGKTWSPSRVVTDNPPTDTTDQFMPTLIVNKEGVLGMLYYDRRDNPDNRGYYARFQASLDGGVTWLPSVRVSEKPWVAGEVAKKSAFAINGGDTAGLVATADGAFYPVWVDDRTGVPQVWTARVTVR